MPSCPFCGNKLGRLEAFIIKNNSIYMCPNCKKVSEIFLGSGIYKALWITQILAVIAFVSAVFLGGVFPLVGLFVILMIFGVFYYISPSMLVLDEPKYVKVKPAWYRRKLKFWKSHKDNSSKKKLDSINKNKIDNSAKLFDKEGNKDNFNEQFNKENNDIDIFSN